MTMNMNPKPLPPHFASPAGPGPAIVGLSRLSVQRSLGGRHDATEPERGTVFDTCFAGMQLAEWDELASVESLQAEGSISQARMMQIQHQMQEASTKKELLRALNRKVDDAKEAAARG